MKVIISSFGSSGDFNPCLGLGRALLGKGVDVLFLSNPYNEKIITEAGLKYIPAGEYFDVFAEIKDNPAYLHSRKGPRAVWALVLRTVPVMYNAMKELLKKESPDLVACHILEFGGMIASLEQSIPYATISPTPMGWFSTNPPSYLNFIELPAWIRRFQTNGIRGMMNIAVKYSLNYYCKKQHIPKYFGSLGQVYAKASLNLGLWSTLLKDHTLDDPPNAKICGFIRDQHIRDWDNIPKEIYRLFDSEKKPIVVGLGSTASLHGDQIYQRSAEICKHMGHPCLLVGKDMEKYADPKGGILAADFAPYGWVFPRSIMVIHHGGLNTTAETLRAGVPALVIPHGYDQFDNAIRTQHAGLSRRIRASRVTSSTFISIIRSILDDVQMHERARLFAKRLRSEPNGAALAVDHIMQTI